MSSLSKPLTERQLFWREHLRRCRAAGQSIAAYAAVNKLSRFGLYDANRLVSPLTVIRPLRFRRNQAT